MMITTKYTHALGDYVLEYIDLRSWTGEYTGTHLTIIYFVILSFLGIILVQKYVIKDLKIRPRNILLIFIALVTVFTIVTNATVISIKGNSDGLLSIGYTSENSTISYKSEDEKYTEFNAEIEMTNYGKEIKKFYLTIISPFTRYEQHELINIYTKDGDKAVFTLDSKETRVFKINLSDYNIDVGMLPMNGSGSGKGIDIILSDAEGNAIRLDDNNFFGVVINR